MSASNNIKGKLALITGASGGIGAACAKKLALQDVDLALTYSTNQLAIEELVAQIRKEHECERPDAGYLRITIHKVDLSSTEETIQLCEDVRKAHGKPVQILFSNAGYGKRIQDIWDIPIEEFDYTLTVNLRASFLLVKGVVEGMKTKQWGRIIFCSSIAAYGAGINGAHYAASKGGLTAMMKNLASRLAPYNITVNDVAPAMIGGTGMIPNGNIVPGLVDSIPIGRLGLPEEVANVVHMFCTTGYATGQSFLLAGGLNHK
ncbi:NAD(P)-binding protein [Patellaria atrata CBS 101060]|uniref:NAD(P)-binding protein n=1 Tax=Patellaria atrata CBS 101060 TaxID=1346257 RepID=A0A9P4SJH1_9PEZI|nr:NAD(P)-binding protein [Patellaria atrata CBS 101060]